MAKDPSKQAPAPSSSRPEIAAFIERVKGLKPAATAGKRGRLVFALDATMSRQPTCLDIQLVYFRGLGECRASGWVAASDKLAGLMSSIDCRGGHTQIGKVLSHARQEHAKRPVQALVFVGDAMEEAIDDLCQAAGELGILGVPVFMFQEGGDPVAESGYREIARLSRGAYCRFDTGAARELGELLRAVAAYAAGGIKALADLSARKSGAARMLLAQLK
jgi:hypothetical protein